MNILLANGDAHLKNWKLLYQDQLTPRLSPAYDIVTTSVCIEDKKEYVLNPSRTKDWYAVTVANFQPWADRADIPWRAIKPHLNDVMDKTRIPCLLARCLGRPAYGRDTQRSAKTSLE